MGMSLLSAGLLFKTKDNPAEAILLLSCFCEQSCEQKTEAKVNKLSICKNIIGFIILS
jgi:hypothetical protein